MKTTAEQRRQAVAVAEPATVLSLLDRLEQAETDVARLTAPTQHDMNTCMDCGRPLVPCTCHEGCPGGKCPVRDCTTDLRAQLEACKAERDLARKALDDTSRSIDGYEGTFDCAFEAAGARVAHGEWYWPTAARKESP